MHTWDYLSEFAEALQEQLESDEVRWGDTWRHRDVGNQTERIYGMLQAYYDQWQHGGNPVPWLKIAGLALIAWVRENHPEALYQDNGL